MMTREELAALVGPMLEERGMELVEVQSIPGRKRKLRVFVDSAGGVNVGNCAEISREIARKLDALPAFGNFVLEVSSPGMNRPIWSLEHFRRFLGERLYFETKEPRNGQIRFNGWIESVEGDVIRLRVENGGVLELSVDAIRGAHLDIDPWKGRC
ncbi:MAG: ribosome maturation factor RimP [Candidatus Eisenbacteria sp.]|nr:ribosome maturation factor RimP [Candidatus Eisenbacteria bacterium]